MPSKKEQLENLSAFDFRCTKKGQCYRPTKESIHKFRGIKKCRGCPYQKYKKGNVTQ